MAITLIMHTAIKHDVAFFDFLRGWSAVLVFFHHAAILGGGPSFLSGQIGQEAVNAFMVASGFLIYFQCATSRSYDQLQSWNGMRNFYIRRFFRIAPAYYFALIAALLISTYLGQCREQIAEVLPSSATSMDRYYIKDYLFSALIHLSFVFGMLPQYSFSTPLPDWSLGLEMQFYLIFPLLYAGCRRNFIIFMPLSLLLMAGIWGLLSRAGVHYPMPSILPLKFHNFAAGMAWAYLMLNTSISLKSRLIVMSTALIFLILGNRSPFMPVLFVLGCWLLNAPSRERGAGFLECIFAHRSSKFLADI